MLCVLAIMPARHLIVGWDGADLALIQDLGPEKLPTLHRLMKQGAYAALQSVQPPATLPNWTSFLTGVNPGQHGVFDFASREGYQLRFTGGTVRQAPLWIESLDAAGHPCACLGFPATWPPPQLKHGVFMSGWDSPVALSRDASFVWPRKYFESLCKAFDVLQFDDIDEFHADRAGWVEALPAKLCARVQRFTDMAAHLLAEREWHTMALYYGESDTAAHYLWSVHDSSSPRAPSEVSDAQRLGLTRLYQALDRALAQLMQQVGQDCELTLLSDHGSGGSSDKVLYLNRVLAEAGLLRFRQSGRAQAVSYAGKVAKQAGLRVLPRRAQQALFRSRHLNAPGRVEAQLRFGAIDMHKTDAFSDELNYFPSIHLNLAGREPQGRVHLQDRERVIRDVEAALMALRDPWTGQSVVRQVWRREELFEGPVYERAPDLLLDMALDRSSHSQGYSYNLMPSVQAPVATSWRRLAVEEYLGCKGRSLPGSHRAQGFALLWGPQVQAAGQLEAHILDLPATLLARMQLEVPMHFDGRVLFEALQQLPKHTKRSLPAVMSPQARQETPQGHIEERLRMLGYIE